MKGIVFVRATVLNDVKGRINYISSEEKQEHLYATYDTAPPGYWDELVRENREEFRKYGTQGKCVEGRELIIALPPDLARGDADEILRFYTDKFREKYGVECSSALHHNKTMKNLHIHLVFSERPLLKEPEEKVATRNMFFAPDGRHVRTKKEATDEKGNLLPGYRMVPKGEIYERKVFGPKKRLFITKEFLEDVKWYYVGLMNDKLIPERQLTVFPKNGPYIATKKIGMNNPKAAEIKETNRVVDEWNRQMRLAAARRIPRESMMEVKRTLINEPVRQSISKSTGKREPEKYRVILLRAIQAVKQMFRYTDRMGREDWAKAWGEALGELMALCIQLVTGLDMTKYHEQKGRER